MNTDQALADLLSHGPTTSIPAALARMRAIEDLLPDSDGLKWFDLLYRMVTDAVLADVESSHWEDRAWVSDLDVIFANLYFEAVRLWLITPLSAPRAWIPLLDARRRDGITELQFALAGMNAHINRDLPVAVVQACRHRGIKPTTDSPQYRDYKRIDDILTRVETTAVEILGRGPVGLITRGLGRLDDVLAMWSVRKARRSAWTHAEVLWSLQDTPELADELLLALDRSTGFAGRGLLVRTG
jgi:hypothetical protein